jgi:HTH-type transcriptional regulator/antitoxin MqsA
MTNPVDPNTGVPLYRDVRPLTLTYKGESITVDMPGWYGDQPDEGVHTADDMKVSDRAPHRLKARAEGLPEPEEIRRIRRKLCLTQAEAGELIGGGPRALQKYETGDYLPSRAISSALTLPDHDPKSLEVLKARRASRVHLGPTPHCPDAARHRSLAACPKRPSIRPSSASSNPPASTSKAKSRAAISSRSEPASR